MTESQRPRTPSLEARIAALKAERDAARVNYEHSSKERDRYRTERNLSYRAEGLLRDANDALRAEVTRLRGLLRYVEGKSADYWHEAYTLAADEEARQHDLLRRLLDWHAGDGISHDETEALWDAVESALGIAPEHTDAP